MSLNVDKNNIGNDIIDNCKSNNVIWENKGITLGLMFYILSKYKTLKHMNIIINNKRFEKIVKTLFPNLHFDDNRYNNFYINIKNNNSIFNF